MENITVFYEDYFAHFGVKSNLTQNHLLIDNPKTVGSILVAYLLFILKIGPNFMKNRPAFKLNNIILVYNALQVLFSLHIAVSGFYLISKHGFLPPCNCNDETTTAYITVIHNYFLVKVIELLDTVFFILRKKDNQATFLHIYHHTYMVGFVWATIRYDPSYATLYPGALNSLIHVFMYTYYALSAFPKMSKYLWWKKYITSMQIIQFFMIISHMIRAYHTSECPPSVYLAYLLSVNVLLFVVLFSRFYIRSYTRNTPLKPTKISERDLVKEKVK